MVPLRQLNEFDFGTLDVVFFQVGEKLLVVTSSIFSSVSCWCCSILYTLNQLCIIVYELWNHGERPHDADVDPHGGFGFQNTTEHGDAITGESVGQVFLMLSSTVF